MEGREAREIDRNENFQLKSSPSSCGEDVGVTSKPAYMRVYKSKICYEEA